jgi:hypothetical protein
MAFVESLYREVEHLDSVNEINIKIITSLLDWLDIRTPLVRSSQLQLTSSKNQRLIDIIGSLRCTAYYSGSAAKSYNDQRLFTSHGVSLYYEDIFDYLDAVKPDDDFVNGLSLLDWIFCYGRDAIIDVLGNVSDMVARHQQGCLPALNI